MFSLFVGYISRIPGSFKIHEGLCDNVDSISIYQQLHIMLAFDLFNGFVDMLHLIVRLVEYMTTQLETWKLRIHIRLVIIICITC